MGTGSPSHDLGGSRLYPKRAREIQAQEGLTTPNVWGPPASGGSTPLREVIPESPNQDGFPDFMPPSDASGSMPTRRARAGTVPSRFGTEPPPGLGNVPLGQKPSRSSAASPFRPTGTPQDANPSAVSQSVLLSRLRSGSTPQRGNPVNVGGFANPLFAPGWSSNRQRASTLASIRSSESNESPVQGFNDGEKTLDYLGLAEQPQSQAPMLPPYLLNLIDQNNNAANRYRSYSVNAKEKYAQDEEENYGFSGLPSGALTPSAASAAAEMARIQAEIYQHNLAVQAFANQATVNRPRARTAGILDAPSTRMHPRPFLPTPSRLDVATNALDWATESAAISALPDAIRAMQLGAPGMAVGVEQTDEGGIEGPTRALWLGNIPASTTNTSLQAVFGVFGKIESARVLVQKNCGFVNFDDVDSAIRARAAMNGKEIFPGAGIVRIGYAKAPTKSGAGTPNPIGSRPSPSPTRAHGAGADGKGASGKSGNVASADIAMPPLSQLKEDILQTTRDFGTAEQDIPAMAASIDAAIAFTTFEPEIPSVGEPSHTRIHDAPKLREIRKRIDNNQMPPTEIEEVAVGMLPEIAELASDYLGNTVVQKLFEFCSESTKERMLQEIAPQLATIGVHKNGTWAAQKIIDVAKTPTQMQMIIDALRPYTVALFLDQFGNYVLQCCLRFGYPWNRFIFETMISRISEIAHGRFGARAMRACLESHQATRDQQRMLAAAIALHSVQLATNQNGALLLTWLLDTCSFPNRRNVLAPRLLPYLVPLCTHKVAYLTVLKVINQKNEPEARDEILKALFFSPENKVLQDILSDPVSGATLIFKVLTTPFFDEQMRNDVVQNVRDVLGQLKVSPHNGYKRLMDEVGMSQRFATKDATPGYTERGRSMTQGSRNGQSSAERQAFPAYGASAGVDGNGLGGYGDAAFGNAPFVGGGISQQMPYQQNYATPAPRGMSPSGVYGGYPTPPASGFQQSAGSHMAAAAMQGGAYPGSGYSPSPAGNNGMGNYGNYSAMPPYYPHQQQQGQQGGGRRGRVSSPAQTNWCTESLC